MVPDITSVNWGHRDQPKIWGQASVGGEDSGSELLSGSGQHRGYALCSWEPTLSDLTYGFSCSGPDIVPGTPYVLNICLWTALIK